MMAGEDEIDSCSPGRRRMDRGPRVTLPIYIVDATAKKCYAEVELRPSTRRSWPRRGGGDDYPVNPGDTVTIMTSDLFDGDARLHASYASGGGRLGQCVAARVEAVTINALMAGEAKSPSPGSARMAASSLDDRLRPCRTSPSSRSL